MTDKGMSMETAAWIMSLFGPASLVGRVATGLMLDRFTSRQVILTTVSFPIVACFMLANFQGSLSSSVVVVIFAGVALGIEGDIMAYFISRYFGIADYASIYAAMLGLFALGYGGIPTIAGFIFDFFGSYGTTYFVLGILSIAAAISMLLLGSYPDAEDAG
jgi:predicted MFS family arabinose efflux permease